MAKAKLTTRAISTTTVTSDNLAKASQLTHNQLDSNFINLRDATFGVVADDSSTIQVGMDSNLYIQGGDNVTTSTDSAGVVTITGASTATSLTTDGLTIADNDIKGTRTNENIVIDPAGTGSVSINKVAITGGTVTGITDLVVADGGTGASSLTSNAVLTGTGTSPITAEGNLTFNGSTLAVTGAATVSTTLGVTGASTLDGVTITDNTISTNDSNANLEINANGSGTVVLENLSVAGDGATVTGILDEDAMGSNSAVKLATQQSIKSYVDAKVTAEDLDFQGDSGGALNIDLDSETLDIAGGTGIDTTGSSNTLTVAIDSTVATLTGSQTLTNKNLTAPTITGTATIDNLTFNDNIIGSASNANISLQPGGTGNIVAGAITINGTTLSSDDSTKITLAEAVDITGAVGITSGTITGITDLTVADGGTGASSLTSNAVLTGNGTSAITAEGNLSFDGSTLAVTGNITATTTIAATTDITAGGNISSEGIQLVDNKITATRTNDNLYLQAAGSGGVKVFPGDTFSVSPTNDFTNELQFFHDTSGNFGAKIYNNSVSGTQIRDGADQSSPNSRIGLLARRIFLGGVDTNVSLSASVGGGDFTIANGDNPSELSITNHNSIVLTDSNDGEITINPKAGKWVQVDGVNIQDNTISSNASNANLELSANGSGTVEVLTDINVTGAITATTSIANDAIKIDDHTISGLRSNDNIIIDPAGTGDVVLGNFRFDVDQSVASGQDNYVLTYDHSGGKISLEASAGGGASTGDITFVGSTISSPSNADLTLTTSGTGDIVLDALRINGTTLDSSDSSKITIAEALDVTGAVTITSGTITGITDITVSDGGTGASSLTDGGVLLGSGTGAITAMAVLSDGEMIVGDGSTDPVAESGATLRTSIGVGTGDSPQFTGLTISGSSALDGVTITDNTISSNASNADLEISGNGSGNVAIADVAITGGTITGITDLTVADGGTGASSLTDNAVLTGTGTSAITAEGNLSFSGSTLAVTGAITATTDITATGTIGNDAISITDNKIIASRSNDNLYMQPSGTGVTVTGNADWYDDFAGLISGAYGSTSRLKGNAMYYVDEAIVPGADRTYANWIQTSLKTDGSDTASSDARFRNICVMALDINGSEIIHSNISRGAQAMNCTAYMTSSSTDDSIISSATGFIGYGYVSPTANGNTTVTNFMGVKSNCEVNAGNLGAGKTALITNAYGYHYSGNNTYGTGGGGTATITNSYGYYADMNADGGATSWAFYDNRTAGSNSQNRLGAIQLINQSGAPTHLANHSWIYALDDSASSEVYVKDEAGNATKISPHNKEGEWEYYSKNSVTGKTVRVNMEKMIRKLEEVTGESFIETI